jgi:hypothetical protein
VRSNLYVKIIRLIASKYINKTNNMKPILELTKKLNETNMRMEVLIKQIQVSLPITYVDYKDIEAQQKLIQELYKELLTERSLIMYIKQSINTILRLF